MSNFENAKVLVKQGWLQGYIEENVKIFKGIPYAAPPIGDRRFRHPEDPERWRGVRKATQYSAAAIQHVMEQAILLFIRYHLVYFLCILIRAGVMNHNAIFHLVI